MHAEAAADWAIQRGGNYKGLHWALRTAGTTQPYFELCVPQGDNEQKVSVKVRDANTLRAITANGGGECAKREQPSLCACKPHHPP